MGRSRCKMGGVSATDDLNQAYRTQVCLAVKDDPLAWSAPETAMTHGSQGCENFAQPCVRSSPGATIKSGHSTERWGIEKRRRRN